MSSDLCPTPNPAGRCQLADAAARSAVKQVFAILGVDVDDPAAVEAFREDLRFGRMMRKATDRGVMSMVALIFTALAMALSALITARFGGQ